MIVSWNTSYVSHNNVIVLSFCMILSNPELFPRLNPSLKHRFIDSHDDAMHDYSVCIPDHFKLFNYRRSTCVAFPRWKDHHPFSHSLLKSWYGKWMWKLRIIHEETRTGWKSDGTFQIQNGQWLKWRNQIKSLFCNECIIIRSRITNSNISC